MASCDHLQALMTKNFILMKRNWCATLCEILFPIILMILLALFKSLYKQTDITLSQSDYEFLMSNSTAYPSLINISNIAPLSNLTSNTSSNSFYGLSLGTGRL